MVHDISLMVDTWSLYPPEKNKDIQQAGSLLFTGYRTDWNMVGPLGIQYDRTLLDHHARSPLSAQICILSYSRESSCIEANCRPDNRLDQYCDRCQYHDISGFSWIYWW